jgi:NitT/TauT family transport system substrate-binding protein
MRRVVSALCLSLALACAAAAVDAPAERSAIFLPHWLPQAQFAGYYVAQERGFYRRRGIELTILTGGPGRPVSEALATRQVNFATLWLSTAIELRSHGVPLVNVAQVVQRSALMLVAKKSSGIREPRDLEGRKVGVWEGDFRLQPEAFFAEQGLHVRLVPLGSTANLFLRDGIDVMAAMWYNEYHTILAAGVEPSELVTFLFQDYGLNFPEDGLYCREETDPELCRAFVAASFEGWRWAFDHPEEALDVVVRAMAAAHVPANRVHQRWMLARMKDLVAPAATEMGRLRHDDYERVGSVLLAKGAIAAVPDFAAFYRPGTP